MKTVYTNAVIVDGGKLTENIDVVTENGVITELAPRGGASGEVIDLDGAYLSAGWIDLHCHGGDGYEFIDGTKQAVTAAAKIHALHGTRVLYPTISACDAAAMTAALEAIEAAGADCPLFIAGVHLEGPYLSPEMSGAQSDSCIRPPDEAEYRTLVARFGALIRRWTYAPECDDGSFLRFLGENGIKASIGHSAAVYDEVKAALAGGADLVTHLYSCTSTVTRRSGFRRPGIVESAFLMDDMFVEIIADGCHLPEEMIRLILKIKGSRRVCAVTDAIRPAGMTVAQAPADAPYIIEDGVAKLADRSAFAGSIATTDRLLRVLTRCGVPLAEAVRMMTETPAKAMGLTDLGAVAPGRKALFTIFDKDLNVLPVCNRQ